MKYTRETKMAYVHGGQLISKCLMIPLHCCSVIVNRLQQVHLWNVSCRQRPPPRVCWACRGFFWKNLSPTPTVERILERRSHRGLKLEMGFLEHRPRTPQNHALTASPASKDETPFPVSNTFPNREIRWKIKKASGGGGGEGERKREMREMRGGLALLDLSNSMHILHSWRTVSPNQRLLRINANIRGAFRCSVPTAPLEDYVNVNLL